jgi:hypothetical protein
MNLPVSSSTPLRLTLALEQLDTGAVAASIVEFPQCRIEAVDRATAIAQIQTDMATLIAKLEFLPLEIPQASPSISPWIKYAGMFENDPDFAAIAATIRADRDREDDTEVDPAVYAIEA